MNRTKLNDWLQTAAAVGVIAGLVLVAYEIRISNRIGIEQGNAAAIERWEVVQQLAASPEIAGLFVRAHEGDELTRTEVVMLNSFFDQFILTVDFDLQLAETETLPISAERYQGAIQYYVLNDYFKRRWPTLRDLYEDRVVAVIDAALSAPRQRDILAYLDYIRGATDQLE